MSRPVTRHRRLLLSLVFCTAVAGCNLQAAKEKRAFESYQAALASGDTTATKKALQALVAANDSQPDYWLELGKLNLQLSDYGAAYNAFQRAHELDRANAQVLNVMTVLALRTGNFPLAEENARQLELVAPGDPAVLLTRGYVALRRGNLDEANKQAEQMLGVSGADPAAKVLRARVLILQQKSDEAVAMLEQQVASQPSDQMSLRALLGLYQYHNDYAKAAVTAAKILRLQPRDQAIRAQLIDSAIRAGKPGSVVQETIEGLKIADLPDIEKLVDPWLASGSAKLVTGPAAALAGTLDSDRRWAIARFLALAGEPDRVIALTKGAATLPVEASNLRPNALYGSALATKGQTAAASARLDAVLAIDNQNADALRGRAELRSRLGQHTDAVDDAMKLVAADQTALSSRLLLAKIYLAAGNPDGARRTLWDAFHDMPAERPVYEALRGLVLKLDGPQAAQRLSEEFEDQRNDKMTRSFA